MFDCEYEISKRIIRNSLDQGKYRPSSKTWKAAIVVRVEGDGAKVVVRFSGYNDSSTLPAAQVWRRAETMERVILVLL